MICCFIIDFPEIGIGISIFVGNVLLLYIVVVSILVLLPTTASISASVIVNIDIVDIFLNHDKNGQQSITEWCVSYMVRELLF